MPSPVSIIPIIIALLSSTNCSPFGGDTSTTPVATPSNYTGVVMGYFSSSLAQYQRVSDIAWSNYTHMVFDGAYPMDGNQLTFGTDDDNTAAEQNARDFVEMAKKYNVKALLGVGGDQGSSYFSSYLSSDDTRNDFVQIVYKLATNWNFDGVVVEWLSPNDPGVIGCNTKSQADVSNYGLFAQALKTAWSQAILIVRSDLRGFIGASGSPATPDETSLLVKNVDYVDLMAYDGYTGNKGKSTGPFSAQTSKCPNIPPGADLSNGINELLEIMKSQGFSEKVLILGFTGYGRLFNIPQKFQPDTKIYQLPNVTAPRGGSTDDLFGTKDPCGNIRGYEGVYLLTEIIQAGWLASDGVTPTSSDGTQRGWDDCAIQPYLYSADYLLVYDDPQSLKSKSNTAKTNGFAGVSLFLSFAFPNEFLQAATIDWIKSA
ncbi:hypothetical protein PCANC_12664 [Puccinia coronata f. sp. avenae]|uniref:GH18 domain-containing protein n=1 Tax=Puccinia coronata f. sp. avenae TaxID=200324 RepID=A0A2N5SY54_9BASI|nr:hypothetical protein PCANC_12664 [Puccinia coronata f. sp. avenae]PLW23441.1 hypothetical protein PCASD_12743 [Puccinia coronata f. sp. avenae]